MMITEVTGMKLTLAENIRAFRKERRLTQEQFAEAMGVTVGSVYKWETGQTIPELSMLVKTADFFDVSMDVLLGYNSHHSLYVQSCTGGRTTVLPPSKRD